MNLLQRLSLAFVLLTGCQAPVLAGQATVNPGDAVQAAVSLPTLMRGLPWLCDLDGGRWCVACPDCAQGNSGPLCCVSGYCVEWTGSHCSGVLGWCFDYTTKPDPATGITVAECHDQ